MHRAVRPRTPPLGALSIYDRRLLMRTVVLAATMLVAMAGPIFAEALSDAIAAHNKGD
jgi:hypothetical protein